MASDTVGTAKIKLEFDDKSLETSTKAADKSLSAWTVAAGNMITKGFEKAVSAVGDIMSTGMNFDKAMSQVAATMGVATDQIEELRDYAKEMGSTTAFSANQAAEALNYMALAGYDADKSMAMLPKVLNLAAAGSMELAAASDMVTDAQSALGLTMDQTDTLIDQMAKTSSRSNTSVSQLGEAILTVGGTAKNLAGGTKELNMMLGVLADNGIKGAEGGTALRNVILSLSAPTDKAAKLIEQMGLEVYDAEGNMRPLNDTFTDLQKILSTMDQKQQTEVLNTIFNKVDLKSANALLGTTADRFNELGTEIDGAAGSAEEMANTQLDNLSGDVTLLDSAFESLKISLEESVAPILRGVVQTVTDFVTWLGQNQGVVIGVIAGITAAMVIYNAQAIIAAVTNPFAWIAVAIAAIGALVGFVIQHFEEIANFVGSVFQNIGDFVNGIFQGIGDFFAGIGQGMMDFLQGVGDFFISIFQNVGDFFASIFQGIFDFFSGIFQGISLAVEAFGIFFQGIFQGIGDFFHAVFDGIFNFFSWVFQGFTLAVQIFSDFFSGIFQGISDFFTAIFQGIFDFFSGIFQGISDGVQAFGDFFQSVFQNVGDFFHSIFSGVQDFFGSVSEGMKSGIEGVGNFFNNVFQNVGNFFNSIFQGIGNVASNVGNGIKSVFKGVGDFISGIVNNIKGFFEGLWNGIKTGFEALKTAVQNIFNTIAGIIKAPINGIISAINGVIDGINSIKVPDWVPFIGGASANIGKIPLLAQGGYADSAALAIFGEQGKEAVLPLENNTDNWSGLLAETLMEAMEERDDGSVGGQNIVINNYATISNDYDAQKLSDMVVREIRRAA